VYLDSRRKWRKAEPLFMKQDLVPGVSGIERILGITRFSRSRVVKRRFR
jgi:hypothetical protein